MNLGWENIIGILGALIIIPWFGLWLFKKIGIVEHKKWADYYNRIPVPNAQGIWLRVTLIILIALIGWKYIDNQYTLIYMGSITILSIIATIDLFKPIPSWIRLFIQIGLFASIVYFG